MEISSLFCSLSTPEEKRFEDGEQFVWGERGWKLNVSKRGCMNHYGNLMRINVVKISNSNALSK